MNTHDMIAKHITVDPEIHHGKPCVRGTRIPVHIIIENMALGLDTEAIQKEFAPITSKDIQACMLYAAMLTDEQEVLYKSA